MAHMILISTLSIFIAVFSISTANSAWRCPNGNIVEVNCTGARCAELCAGTSSNRTQTPPSGESAVNRRARNAAAINSMSNGLLQLLEDKEGSSNSGGDMRQQDYERRINEERERMNKVQQEKEERDRNEQKVANDEYENLMQRYRGGGSKGGKTSQNSKSDGNRQINIPEDYSGRGCSFFTRPAIEEGRMNFYADDSAVEYDGLVYKCVERRWKKLGPKSAYPKVRNAADIEHP